MILNPIQLVATAAGILSFIIVPLTLLCAALG